MPSFTCGATESLCRAWSFNGQTFQTSPVSQGTILNPAGYSNMAPLSISSNGSTAGTGIVWAAASLSGNANASTVPGQLWAFDADDLTHELWDSQQNSARDGVGNFAKFNPPTVVNGKVYLATFSDQLLVYGLLAPPNFSLTAAPSSQSVAAGDSASYIVYVNPQPGFTGTVAVTCSGLPSGASCSPASVSVPSGSGQVSAPLTVNTTTSTAGGNFSFTISGTSGNLFRTTTAGLTVTAATPSFALTATALAPATISPGGSATSTITVAPSGGFNSTVNLSCALTPATAVPPRCSFSSASVSGGSGTPTLTVSTVAATASVRPNGGGSLYYALVLPWFGLTLLGARFGSRVGKRLLSVCFMLLGLVWLAACGGGSSSGGNGGGGAGTTAGNYTVRVTATSGALIQAQTLAVTVQ